MVTGAHLCAEYGMTVQDIEGDGFPVAARVEMPLTSDTGEVIATAMGTAAAKMAPVLAHLKPDLLLVLGDRTEVLATAVAALPQLIPMAHIHGGESSEGAIDEGIRHAVTKLSHLHFAATNFYARRLIQMGEEEWRVHVSGAPGLEHIRRGNQPCKEDIEQELGLDLSQPSLLLTYHPVTLSKDRGVSDVVEVLAAVEASGLPVVITYPNADMGGREIIRLVEAFQARYSRAQVRVNLGSRLYLGLLRHVAALVGNSSSGIIEAASFGQPVVNVGDRQRGRLRSANVIDVAAKRDAIVAGIEQAMDPGFKKNAAECANPYDHGKASDTILSVLKEVELGPRLIQKRFMDHSSTLAALGNGERL